MTDRARLQAAIARLQPQTTDPGVWDELAADNAALAPARARANRVLLDDGAGGYSMAGVWTAIVVDQWGEVHAAPAPSPDPHHRIMVVRALCDAAYVDEIQGQQVLYEAQGWKPPEVEWVEAQAVAAALNAVQEER